MNLNEMLFFVRKNVGYYIAAFIVFVIVSKIMGHGQIASDWRGISRMLYWPVIALYIGFMIFSATVFGVVKHGKSYHAGIPSMLTSIIPSAIFIVVGIIFDDIFRTNTFLNPFSVILTPFFLFLLYKRVPEQIEQLRREQMMQASVLRTAQKTDATGQAVAAPAVQAAAAAQRSEVQATAPSAPMPHDWSDAERPENG